VLPLPHQTQQDLRPHAFVDGDEQCLRVARETELAQPRKYALYSSVFLYSANFSSVTNFVINDFRAAIDRAKRDYDTLRISVSALEHAVCRTIEHAKAAVQVLGTEGLLAYFEEVKSDGDPDAIELLNRIANGFNDMMAPPARPDSIASVSPYSTSLFLFTTDFSFQTPRETALDEADEPMPSPQKVSFPFHFFSPVNR
jgi:hypothetical protein